MSFRKLSSFLTHFIEHIEFLSQMNHSLGDAKHRKIRMSNFPSEISENLVKFVMYRTYGIIPCLMEYISW